MMLRLYKVKAQLPKAILPFYLDTFPEHDNEKDFERLIDTWFGVEIHEDILKKLEKLVEIIRNT